MQESERLRQIDVPLQRGEVRLQLRIAVIVVPGERPTELACRLLGHARTDLLDGVVVLRVEIPADDAQGILEQIDEGRAMGVNEGLARRPHDELRKTKRVL